MKFRRRPMVLVGLLAAAIGVLAFQRYRVRQWRTRLTAARTYLETGRPGKALAQLRPLLDSGRADPELLLLGARTYRLMGLPAKALEHAEAAAAAGADPTPVALEQGLALFELGRFGEAEPKLKAAASKEALAALTQIHLELLEMDQVLTDLAAWVQLDAADATPHLLRGEVWLGAGHFEQAVEALQQALKLDPRHSTARYKLATAFVELGRLDEAATLLRECLRDRPREFDVQYLLGKCELERGNRTEARSVFDALIAQHPDHPPALVALGKLELDEQNHQRAVELLGRAVQLDEADESAVYNLALALQRTGRTEEAETRMARAQQLQQAQRRLNDLRDRMQADPADLESRCAAGNVLLELGQPQQAARLFAAVLARAPDHAGAREGLARIQGGSPPVDHLHDR